MDGAGSYIVGVGTAIGVDMVAISGEETSAPHIGHIAVDDVYFRDDQCCGEEAAGDGDVPAQAVVSTAATEGTVLDHFTAVKIA